MGLDAVELMMRVEDEFEISVPDEHYGQFGTVGDLSAYIGNQGQTEAACLNPAAFVRIRRSLMTRFGLARRQVRTATDLEELFPIESRRQQWTAFEASLGLRVPALEYSRWQKQQTAGMVLGIVVALALLSFLHPTFLIGCLITPIVALAALAVIDDRLARTFPMRAATVGALTQSVASLNPYQLSNEIGRPGFNDNETWARLRRVVSQTLGIPEEEISPDSRFIEDLLVD